MLMEFELILLINVKYHDDAIDCRGFSEAFCNFPPLTALYFAHFSGNCPSINHLLHYLCQIPIKYIP